MMSLILQIDWMNAVEYERALTLFDISQLSVFEL